MRLPLDCSLTSVIQPQPALYVPSPWPPLPHPLRFSFDQVYLSLARLAAAAAADSIADK